MYSFSYLEPVCCSMSNSNCCFLTCIQTSQEAGQVVWYSQLFQNFPQFIVIHTVTGFGIVNKAEVDVFLELLLFWWSSRCWQFDLWFLCLFWNQLKHLEDHGSCIAEAWLGEWDPRHKLVQIPYLENQGPDRASNLPKALQGQVENWNVNSNFLTLSSVLSSQSDGTFPEWADGHNHPSLFIHSQEPGKIQKPEGNEDS